MTYVITQVDHWRVLAELASITARIAPGIARQLGEGQTGGYLFICNGEREPFLRIPAGKPDRKKAADLIRFSYGEIARLHEDPEDVLSWRSQDPNRRFYGGAIRLPSNEIMFFSGFPEQKNGPFCVTVAQLAGVISEEKACEIMVTSGEYMPYLAMITAAHEILNPKPD